MYDRTDAELTMDTPPIEEDIIDSMGIFRLITFLEQQFGFTMKHEDVVLESFETIEAIAHPIETRSA